MAHLNKAKPILVTGATGYIASWKYLKRKLGIPFEFDNSYSKTDLGIEYRPVSQTCIEHVEQLDRDGLI